MAKLPDVKARKRFTREDIDSVVHVLKCQDELWPYSYNDEPEYWKKFRSDVKDYFENNSKKKYSVVPVSSGTAAIHVAIGGLELPAGTEIIVPPITDMGTIMPIIFQNCIPVFADVDEDTGLLTAETIAEKISERTSAVIVVHLAGSPADMNPIVSLCNSKSIKVIEDCAQALGAYYEGQAVGTFGHAAAYSLNSWKHVTSGEGGFVLVEGDDSGDQFLRSQNFADKHRKRMPSSDKKHSSYYGTGLNYRMSDLELVLAISQFNRLSSITSKFTQLGQYLDSELLKIPGIVPQVHHEKATSTYFFGWFRLETEDADLRNKIVSEVGSVASDMKMRLTYSYGEIPLYEYNVFQSQNFFPYPNDTADKVKIWPARLVAEKMFENIPESTFSYSMSKGDFQNTQLWCKSGFGLMFDERHNEEHIDAFLSAFSDSLRTHS